MTAQPPSHGFSFLALLYLSWGGLCRLCDKAGLASLGFFVPFPCVSLISSPPVSPQMCVLPEVLLTFSFLPTPSSVTSCSGGLREPFPQMATECVVQPALLACPKPHARVPVLASCFRLPRSCELHLSLSHRTLLPLWLHHPRRPGLTGAGAYPSAVPSSSFLWVPLPGKKFIKACKVFIAG